MKEILAVDTTSRIEQIYIRSTISGGGLTGLTNASSGLVAYYHRDSAVSGGTAISLVTMTVGTYTSSGFAEIDATNMPGWYQFCPPTAALASGAKTCAFHFQGATNMVATPLEVQLTAFDLQIAGLTAAAAVNISQGGVAVITGTAVTGTLSSTAMSCSGNAASSTNSIWIGRTVIWTSGVLLGSQALVSAYNGTTKVITYATTQTAAAPSNGDTFVII